MAKPCSYIPVRVSPPGTVMKPSRRTFVSTKSSPRSMCSPNSPRPGWLPLAMNAMHASPLTPTLRL